MPAPEFKKITIQDKDTLLFIFAAGIQVRCKFDRNIRRSWRIVLKPASENPGMLFQFKKLTMQAQQDNFEKLMEVPEVQQWLLQAAKKILYNRKEEE